MADAVSITASHNVPLSSPDPTAPSFTSQSFRKRRRSSKQSPKSAHNPKVSKATLTPGQSPKPLTGAAAIADEQRAKPDQEIEEARNTSPNPARKALGDLMGSQRGMSKPQDAPNRPHSLNQGSVEIASSLEVPDSSQHKASITAVRDQSPIQQGLTSGESFGAIENAVAPTIIANGAPVASPGQMDDMLAETEGGPAHHEHRHLAHTSGNAESDEGRSNKAFTYPGPALSAQAQRTSSLPQSGYGGGRDSTRSPSTKRHKCPYCSTDFTRHHNLKSHLLTHSQEKPYSCDTCDARFRRLHDLKRHTKLHTGERPHVCPRCDRSFARGDALARHTKGQGGCAGRRSSISSLGGDEKHEGGLRADGADDMHGIMYTGETSHEPENMDEDTQSPGERSLPSIRKHDVPPFDHYRQASDNATLYQSRQSNTYPPVAARPQTGGLYPPPSTSPRDSSGAPTPQASYFAGPSASPAFSASGPNVFAQGGMTESPKPLSPAGMTSHQLGHPESGIHRNRSPSMRDQLQQQQYNRRMTGNNTSPPMSLPPPHSSVNPLIAPHLPSLPGLNPPESRFTLPSQGSGPSHLHASASNSLPGPLHGPSSPSHPPGNASSANNSLSSHSTGHHSSHDRALTSNTQTIDQLWAYVRSLEMKVDKLQDEFALFRNQQHAAPQQHR